ncbi:hypothetical protein BKA70DRAFT_1319202 [Coprinopsis sp. MPI-PUGE-AT-0042]|nr:hypothetical protein BKA70DRAFT_1319202 [Coprinopsis sp. MPI-PUGE-AT-0042]
MNSRQPISSLTYIQCPASPSPATFTIPPADPRLFPYTTVNDPIPDTLLPVLDEHLGKFSKSLVSINQELADLEGSEGQVGIAQRSRSLPMEIMTCLEDPQGQDVDPSDMANLPAVSDPLLWRSLKLDFDRIERFYKKMKVHEEVPTAEVTESLSEWYGRAGSIDTVPVEDSTVGIAGILAAFLAPCTVVEGSQPSWGRWHLIIHRGSGSERYSQNSKCPSSKYLYLWGLHSMLIFQIASDSFTCMAHMSISLNDIPSTSARGSDNQWQRDLRIRPRRIRATNCQFLCSTVTTSGNFLGEVPRLASDYRWRNGCRWTKAELDWILHQFTRVQTRDTLLRQSGLTLSRRNNDRATRTSCQINCMQEVTDILDMENAKWTQIPFYLPCTEKGKANLETAGRIFDVQFLQQAYGKKYISPAYLGVEIYTDSSCFLVY